MDKRREKPAIDVPESLAAADVNEALRQSEHRLRQVIGLLEAVTAGTEVIIAAQDTEFRYVFFNNAYQTELKRLTGKDLRIGMTMAEILADMPDQLDVAFREWRRAMGGETLQQQIEFGDPARHRRIYNALKSPLRDAEGRVWGAGEVAWDITPQARAEEELRKSRDNLEQRVAERTRELALSLEQVKEKEEILRNVLEMLPVGVWILDKQGGVQQANKAAREIWAGAKYVGLEELGEYWGWRAESGTPIGPLEWAGARAVLKGETTLNEEVEIESFDGLRKIIFDSAVPLRGPGGEITGAITVNQDITARRKGEAARREQAAAIDLAYDAIFNCALDGTILSWNHGAELMYGWTREEALGQVSHLLLRSEFQEPIERITEKVVQNGRWEGEFAQTDRRGKHMKSAGRWALKKDAQGRPSAILKINIDITESKKTEDALKASWQYTRSLIEASLDALVTISPDGKITDVNKATELMTAVPRWELVGSDFSDYFTEPAKAREGYRRVFAAGAVRDYPLTMRNAAGGTAEVLYNATVYRNEAGEVQGVIAAARDISERKKAEDERLRLVKALEQADESILIMDTDLEILYVNPAFERISGLRSKDILMSNYGDVLRMTGEKDGLDLEIGAALKTDRRWNGHMVRRKGDGSVYALDILISPVLDDSGYPKNFVAVERDVTEAVRLQENLRQGQKMEALGTLAGGIAHDFNNILMPILINTEAALMHAAEGSLISRQLKLVLEAAHRGRDLIKQITTFSRRRETEKKIIRVNPIFKEGLKFLRSSIPRNIEIVDNLKAAAATVRGDAGQIHQILMNLCSNAAYAMREKGGVLEVSLAAVEIDPKKAARLADLAPGPYVRLSVRDTGPGMAPEIKDRIFDPFFTTKAPGEGTGMGLPAVHGIVKAMGGAIRVDSEVGKGTVFEIFLPRAKGRPDSKPAPPPSLSRGKERILFVDDEPMQIRSVPPLLERLGYQVVGEIDARKALRIFRRKPGAFDLVITDQMMPFLTGEKLALALLRLRPDLPIILCTGFSETIDEAKAKALGIAALLMKPFSIPEIAAVIRRVLAAKT